jgi:hemerythrin
MALTWRDEFSVGIPEVDHEHRELIGMINALLATLGPHSDNPGIIAALGEIHGRIAAHFALEEREMRSLRYIGLGEHKKDHERLLDDIVDIMADVESPEGYAPAAMEQRLMKWFSVHFRTQDAKLHRWLLARG